MELERRLNAGFITLLFVCLLACYYFMTFPTSLGAPLRERQESFITIVLTVCEQCTENLSSNRKKIALKPSLN